MIRADVITLIKEDPTAHGAFDTPALIMREVMCTVASVGMNETYTAMSQGLSPQYRFILALAEDYENERRLIFHGEHYRIIRTYINGDGIELTAERVTGDV